MFKLKKNIFYLLIIFIFFIKKSLLVKFPIYKDIEKSEITQKTSISISSKVQYLNYILNNDYIISLIYFGTYQDFSFLINKYDKISSYKITEKWKFLKIGCEEPNDLCDIYENNDRTIPIIKIYIKSVEQKTIYLINNFEVPELLELLVKYSNNPLIEIKDKKNINEFYNKYGTFSPLVIYDNKKN